MLVTTPEKLDTLEKNPALSWLRQWWPWIIVAGLTVAAFIMRRKGLATQSLWFDEADLIARARRDPGAILGDFLRPGENGPLYTLLMHFWLQIVGNGEAAVRTPSLLAGTLTVPAVYELGRKFLGGRLVGLVAAGLVTVSPYQLWYSQDAKMYPLAVLLTLVSVYLFLIALEKGGRGWWVAYVILTTLSFYIHLMSALIVAVEVAYYFLLRRLNRKSPVPEWGKIENRKLTRRAWISLGLLTLPYLPIAIWQGRALWDGGIGKTWFQPVGLFAMLNTLTRRFSVNRIDDPLLETLGALLYAGLVVLGLVVVWRRQRNFRFSIFDFRHSATTQKAGGGNSQENYSTNSVDQNATNVIENRKSKIENSIALLLSLYLLLPIVAFYLLTWRIPLFAERYLLIASPAYYYLAAIGLLWLGRKFWPAAGLVTAGGLALVAVALLTYNYAKTPQKEDWRGAMHWLQGQLRDGDEVLVVPGYLNTAVNYYLKTSPKTPVYALPQELLDRSQDRALNTYLTGENGILRGHERVWFVVSDERYSQDNPEEYVQNVWFRYNTFNFTDPQVFLGVKIFGYSPYQIPGTDADYFPRLPTDRTNLMAGNSLKLEGYDILPTEQPDPAKDEPSAQVRYDENLHLSFYWRKQADDHTDYEMDVRLVDQNGRDTATNYTAQPLSGYYPTSQWRVGQAVRDYRDLYIHVPPGRYYVELSVHPKGQPQNLLPFTGNTAQQTVQTQRFRLETPIVVVAK